MILALFRCQTNVFERDARALTHPAENSIVREEECRGCVEFSNSALIHNADTIVGYDGTEAICREAQK